MRRLVYVLIILNIGNEMAAATRIGLRFLALKSTEIPALMQNSKLKSFAYKYAYKAILRCDGTEQDITIMMSGIGPVYDVLIGRVDLKGQKVAYIAGMNSYDYYLLADAGVHLIPVKTVQEAEPYRFCVFEDVPVDLSPSVSYWKEKVAIEQDGRVLLALYEKNSLSE